jgi:ring-1,2-phenylacetyl-CoA epoxidase subunit PaaE
MGLFNKLFGGKEKKTKSKKATLKIKSIERLTEDAVKVTFDVPSEVKMDFTFIPGQYLDLEVNLEGETLHRSYSICSDVKEPLAIGVKKVEGGKVSTWLNDKAKAGDEMVVAFPKGNFTISKIDGDYVAFAAGSGITPVLSIAKFFSRASQNNLTLFYGNRNEDSIMFKDELDQLENVKVHHILSRQEKEGFEHGRLSADKIRDFIKSDLDLLKSKGFFLCGPEEVILNASDVLKTFGVPEDKIHYELFTPPTLLKSKQKETVADFKGVAKVTIVLDEEEEHFDLESDGATILDEAESYGIDAPFSCRGGVCCTCKAKVLEGAVTMDKNFTLTDSEIEEGYILTCQSHPNSEHVKISYDD